LARRIGITKQSVNKMMNGHTEPSLSRLYDIGDALEIDIKTLL
jgi:transcriptional regulator with XRE-family HTH domain